jgi:phage terminase small subunit
MPGRAVVEYAPREPPAGLKDAGKALWKDTVAEVEFDPHHLRALGEACKTLDEVHSLKSRLEADGSIVDSPQGQKVHPALPELRQARMTLARLLASLKIPAIQ